MNNCLNSVVRQYLKRISIIIIASVIPLYNSYACSFGGRGPITYIPLGDTKINNVSFDDYLKKELNINEWEEVPFKYSYKENFPKLPLIFENVYLKIKHQPIIEQPERAPMKISFKKMGVNIKSLSIIYETEAELFEHKRYHNLDINKHCGGRKHCDHRHVLSFGKLVTFNFSKQVEELKFSYKQIGLRGRYIFILQLEKNLNDKRYVVSRTNEVYAPFPCSKAILHYDYYH